MAMIGGAFGLGLGLGLALLSGADVELAGWPGAAESNYRAAVTWERLALEEAAEHDVTKARLAVAEADLRVALVQLESVETRAALEEAVLRAQLADVTGREAAKVTKASRAWSSVGAAACGGGVVGGVLGATLCDSGECRQATLVPSAVLVAAGCTMWAVIELVD